MIKGIGIDLVSINEILDGEIENYAEMLLSTSERKLYENLPNDLAKSIFLAGRYAAKEAIFKAAKKYKDNLRYHNFSVLSEEDGTMYVESDLEFLKDKIHVSMTHTEEYALAYAIIEEVNKHN